jgi:serine phosphatase RsbU (regulator of sigma subunit)
VGGDWYDVIQLSAGRTALVIGDVMGRGVRAAAVMGQVRAAVRAFSRLELSPAEMLRQLDGVVCDLDAHQIVTCVYAVYDPEGPALTFANAGHLAIGIAAVATEVAAAAPGADGLPERHRGPRRGRAAPLSAAARPRHRWGSLTKA